MRVEDRQDPEQPRGKQSITGQPREIDYYCTTGIWQTVWLERVQSARIARLKWTANVERWEIGLEAFIHNETDRELNKTPAGAIRK